MGSGLVPENARSFVVGDPNLTCDSFLRSSVLRSNDNFNFNDDYDDDA